MSTAVIVFPGTNCERDVGEALDALGEPWEFVRHDAGALPGFDRVILPGGFAHGDYLRPGAIAATSPVMRLVAEMARGGAPVLGICNGFQVLCEAGLLPGAFVPNRDLAFICRMVEVEVVDAGSCLTRGAERGARLRLPLNSYEGNWVDPGGRGRTVLSYSGDVNGSQDRAAAVANDQGNVVGIMPHPERAVGGITGSTDGRQLLESFCRSLVSA